MRGGALALAVFVVLLPASAHGAPATGGSFSASIGRGLYVAFDSDASNLVPDDRNGVTDVFLRDRATSTTHRISIGPQRVEANGPSSAPAMSLDGVSVAFVSRASNLVPGDTNDRQDVFVRDIVTDTTELVADGNDESAGPSISADGRYVAFLSYASNLVPGDVAGTWDVFVRDRANGTVERVNVSSDEAPSAFSRRIYTKATISADGRYVAFSSDASNLVDGDTNGTADIFVRDRVAGTTERVSVGPSGEQLNADGIYGAAISADGRYVTFISETHVFLRDRERATTERIDVAANGGACCRMAVSADGRYVAFMSFASNLVVGDTNEQGDVFVRDRATGTTARVSLGASGQTSEQSDLDGISPDGSLIVFGSLADDAHNIFLRDRTEGKTELISAAPDPQMSIVADSRSPRPPRAGRLLTVRFQIAVDGQPVTTAAVSGRAMIHGQRVPIVRKSFANSIATVVWRIPKNARNRYLTATVTVLKAGTTGVAGTFIAIVR